GVDSKRIAQTLDDYAVSRGQTDPRIRERFVRDYLKEKTPADVGTIVNRPPPPGTRVAASPTPAGRPPGDWDAVPKNQPVRVDEGTGSRAIDAKTVDLDAKTGDLDAKTGDLDAKTGDLDAKTGDLDAKTGPLESGAAPSRTGATPAPSVARSAPSDAPYPLAHAPDRVQLPRRTVEREHARPSRPAERPVADASRQESFRWRGPDGKRWVLKGLSSSGKYAEVFEIMEGPYKGHVLKMYYKKKDRPYSDDLGGPAEYGANHIAGDIVYGSELLTDAKVLHLKSKKVVFDVEAGSEGGLAYLIQEKKGARDIVVDDIDRPLTPAQQQAVVDLYDDLAEAGIIWEDGGAGNIFLRDLGGGKWAAGVLDTDRLARFGQIPTERLGAVMDTPLAGPHAGVNSINPARGWVPANAREYMAKALESKGWIRYENGQFVPGRLDPKVAQSKFELKADR
ncbi:MAG TPA: hypothetical protein VMS98_17740, partial [Thermoanaerobaculia bacterium]|nr:hypothetical protein [Thermoanaerobaculia bacterium]